MTGVFLKYGPTGVKKKKKKTSIIIVVVLGGNLTPSSAFSFCFFFTSVQQLDQVGRGWWFAERLPGGRQHSESISDSFGQRGDGVVGLLQVRRHHRPLDRAQRLLLDHVKQGAGICAVKYVVFFSYLIWTTLKHMVRSLRCKEKRIFIFFFTSVLMRYEIPKRLKNISEWKESKDPGRGRYK